MMPELAEVQVVVMMGGVGSRLGKIVADCPKPLLPVGGRPFFEYELKLLTAAGFRRFLFCTGYLSGEIEDHFGAGEKFGIEIDYQKDSQNGNGEAVLLGTGGALRHAYPKLDEDFMLVYADSFMDIDYREAVYRYFEAKRDGALSLMTLLHNDGEFDTSNVIYKDGRLVLYDKKASDPEMDHIDYGVNMFSRSVLDGYRVGERFDLSDIQHGLSERGKLEGLVVKRRFYEIGRPEPYREFIGYAADRFDTPKKAAFLDRDGVLNEIVYNEGTELLDSPMKPGEMRLLPGAADAVRINKRLMELIPEIDDVFVCFHHPEGDKRSREPELIRKCGCRKPGTGLIDEACLKYAVDRGTSFMAGDSYTDIECGRAAGVRTVFIGGYKCDVCARLRYNKPDITAKSLNEAVNEIILNGFT